MFSTFELAQEIIILAIHSHPQHFKSGCCHLFLWLKQSMIEYPPKGGTLTFTDRISNSELSAQSLRPQCVLSLSINYCQCASDCLPDIWASSYILKTFEDSLQLGTELAS